METKQHPLGYTVGDRARIFGRHDDVTSGYVTKITDGGQITVRTDAGNDRRFTKRGNEVGTGSYGGPFLRMERDQHEHYEQCVAISMRRALRRQIRDAADELYAEARQQNWHMIDRTLAAKLRAMAVVIEAAGPSL